jgi:uncharacterized protein DUF4184
MPYTLSHPLAVIPFRRCCPTYLNFPALVIGSMAPDFGYFVDRFNIAKYAHTLPGAVAVCLPASLVVLATFYLLRRPLCYILPQPHRAALTPLASANARFTFRALIVACVSILLGTLTHIVWDSFTHDYGWPVQHFQLLRSIPFQFHRYAIPTYFLLQLLSTVFGFAGLIYLDIAWLRRQPKAISGSGVVSDTWRYLLLTAIVFAAIAISMAAACHHIWPLKRDKTIELLYWTAVYSIPAFFPLLALSSITAYAFRKSAAD